MSAAEPLPSNLAVAHAMILAECAARVEADALAAHAALVRSGAEVLIARLELENGKLRRELYGTSSERKAKLLEQMELQLKDLDENATEDNLVVESAALQSKAVLSFECSRPSSVLGILLSKPLAFVGGGSSEEFERWIAHQACSAAGAKRRPPDVA